MQRNWRETCCKLYAMELKGVNHPPDVINAWTDLVIMVTDLRKHGLLDSHHGMVVEQIQLIEDMLAEEK